MQRIVRTLRTQWLGALGIFVGLTGVAFGATGQPAILGRLNQADRPTLFQNTARGPAATFRTASGVPPFTVSSGVKVSSLNAARVGGRLPSAFARSGASYTKAESDARYGDDGAIETTALLNDIYTSTPQTLFEDGFAPPVPGTLTLRAFGSCSSDGTLVAGQLVVEIGAATEATPIEGPACDSSLSVAVEAGVGRTVRIRTVPNELDAVRFAGGLAVLTFMPD